MVLYLDRICQCGLHAVLWSHIGTLMRILAAGPAVPQDFYSPHIVPLEQSCSPRIRCCGTGAFQEKGQCFIVHLCCSIPIIVFYFSFLFLLSIGRYCGAGVFGLIGCISLSFSLALPTIFNNNNERRRSSERWRRSETFDSAQTKTS